MGIYKKIYYQLTVTHHERDGNIFIEHDCILDAERDFRIFKEADFRVLLNKVTRRCEDTKTERLLKSAW